MLPQRLSILGVGLLGGSLGLAVKAGAGALAAGGRVVGYGHRWSTLDKALQMGAIDHGYDDPAEAVQGADWVVLCTPVGMFEPMLRAIGPALSAGAIVTDVGSTKRSVVEAAERLLPAEVFFVGSHPMAGSEKRGVEFARADLFQDARCILTPTPRTNRGVLEKVAGFWEALGMKTVLVSPKEHDRLLADVSHLPHAVAAALVMLQEDRALGLAGKGFTDTTRIAGGDGGLWKDIFLDNRDFLRQSIRALQGRLEELVRLLEPDRAEALTAWLNAAAGRRDAMKREAENDHRWTQMDTDGHR